MPFSPFGGFSCFIERVVCEVILRIRGVLESLGGNRRRRKGERGGQGVVLRRGVKLRMMDYRTGKYSDDVI